MSSVDVTAVLDNIGSLVVLCHEITAQLGFSPGKVRRDATGTLEAPVGKLGALQDALGQLQTAVRRNPAILPVITENDLQGILNGSRESLNQLQGILRKSSSGDGGLFSKMRKATVGGNIAKDMEDLCKALDIQKTALKLCLALMTTRSSAQYEADDLDEPPVYATTFDAPPPQDLADKKYDSTSDLPSYDTVKGSSSMQPPQQRKAKSDDVKDAKVPGTLFSEATHANNASARDAEFIYAVKNSKSPIPELGSYLSEIDDVNARHPDLGTALQAAVSEDLTNTARWLLENGAHPDMEGGAAGTALKRAVAKGNRAIIDLLLDFGANPNIEEGSDTSGCALEIANPAIFDLLISRGASPDTPRVLYSAMKTHQLWKVERLVKAGAEIEMRWHMYPYSVLNEAVHRGDPGILNFLLAQGADPNAAATGPGPHPSTFTPLSSAVYSNRLEQLKILHKYGVDPLAYVALQRAAGLGHLEIVNYMVEEMGVDVNHQDDAYKRTALMAACEYGMDATVRYLLSRKADIHVQSASKKTALREGVQNIRASCVRLLLEAGANAREKGLLQVAVETGSLTIVKLLIEAGADVNGGSPWKGTALEEAAKTGRTDMIECLVAHGGDINGGRESEKPPLWHAIENQDDSCAKILLDFGATNTGQDFPSCVATRGSTPAVQELASDLDTDLRVSRDKKPDDEAWERGFGDVVDLPEKDRAECEEIDLDW